MESIKGLDLKGKKVIVRVDFNCQIIDSEVIDDTKIRAALDTIKYLIKNNAKVILLSHLGRIEKEEDKENNTLEPVASFLSRLVETNVYFVPFTRGVQLEKTISHMSEGEIVVVENTRYEDYPEKLESTCNNELSAYWASLGDVFVFDAFASAHREHASTYGITNVLPSYAGFLVLKEKEMLDKILTTDNTLIMGGSKVSDKLKLINNLIDKTDKFLIGGAMCFTFLKAKGYEVGKSYVDDDSISAAKDILEKYKGKIILPLDIATQNGIVEVDKLGSEDIGYDIGTKTINLFKEELKSSKLILWNGPLGKYEEEDYEFGTRKILEYLKENKSKETVLAGGDIIAASNKCMITFDHICTGGGATLTYLEGKSFKIFDKLNGNNNEK